MKRQSLTRAMGEADRHRLLDVQEAAALLSVKPATLYQWAYQRRIPHVKLMGRSLRFRYRDLEQLMDAGYQPALRSLAERD